MRKKNKIYTINGFTGTLYEIADHFGVNRSTIHSRIRKFGICDAIVKRIRIKDSDGGAIYEARGFKGNVLDFSIKFKISASSIRNYLREGLEMEEALRKIKKRDKAYKVFGFEGNLKEIGEHFGVKYGTLRWNRSEGRTLEEIIINNINKMERKGIRCSEKLINEVRSYCKENGCIQINGNHEVK